MSNRHTFPYVVSPEIAADNVARPLLPVSLRYGLNIVKAHALVDSGADLNVMPCQLGVALGAYWVEQPVGTFIQGITDGAASRSLSVSVSIGDLPSMKMTFAWTMADVPLILGQIGLFSNFDVCFYRSDGYIELAPRPDTAL